MVLFLSIFDQISNKSFVAFGLKSVFTLGVLLLYHFPAYSVSCLKLSAHQVIPCQSRNSCRIFLSIYYKHFNNTPQIAHKLLFDSVRSLRMFLKRNRDSLQCGKMKKKKSYKNGLCLICRIKKESCSSKKNHSAPPPSILLLTITFRFSIKISYNDDIFVKCY